MRWSNPLDLLSFFCGSGLGFLYVCGHEADTLAVVLGFLACLGDGSRLSVDSDLSDGVINRCNGVDKNEIIS